MEDIKKYEQEKIEKVRIKFVNRTKRANKEVRMPSLNNYYLLDLGSCREEQMAHTSRRGQNLTASQINNLQDDCVQRALKDFKNDPAIVDAHPNSLIKKQFFPNDSLYNTTRGSWGQVEEDMWALKRTQPSSAWDLTQGQGIVVAVVDTGLDYNHPDIAANVFINPEEIPNNGVDDDGNGFIDDVKGWDFTTCTRHDFDTGDCVSIKNPDNDPMDGDGHGTHVSGTIDCRCRQWNRHYRCSAAGENHVGQSIG